MARTTPPIYPSQQKQLVAFGERLRLARLRRELGVETIAERSGISRVTLYRAERGEPSVALGIYLRILAALQLESDLDQVALDDRLGRRLQDLGLPQRRRAPQGK